MAETQGAEMACSSRTAFRRWSLLIAALATILVALLTWMYLPHILFLYYNYSSKKSKNFTIEDRPISLTEIPADWVTVDLGVVTFRMPSQFRPHQLRSRTISEIATGRPPRIYSAGRNFISFDASPTDGELFDTGSAKIRFLPDRTPLTLPEIKLACNQITVKSFSFSMSAKEIAWLQTLLVMKNIGIEEEGDYTESFFFQNIHGCISYSAGDRLAHVLWEEDGTTLGGSITLDFRDRPVDKELVHSLCSSLKIKPVP